MTKDEALKMALDLAEEYVKEHGYGKVVVNAIKEALAQQQEPVAWRYNGKLHEFDPSDWATGPVTPLYTSPPASKPWVSLTDEERRELRKRNQQHDAFAKAIDAALKEKNNG